MGILLLDSPDNPSANPAAYARMLFALLPPGRLWRLVGTALGEFFEACADELGRLDARVGDLFNEADPTTALELLPEYERELDLDEAPTLDERRARITARLIARQRYRPVDFKTALAPLFALDASNVEIVERKHADAVALGDDRQIFGFFAFRDPGLGGTYFLDAAQALVTAIEPSHTLGVAIESAAALYDDSHTLYDRDILAAIPTFVSASVPVVTRSANLVIAAPAGTAAGDCILLLVWVGNDANATLLTGSLPSGWAVMSSILTAGSRRALLLRRTATASEPGTHTFPCSFNGSDVVNGVALAYRHVSLTAAVVAGAASDASATTTFVSPSVTLTRGSDLYVGFAWGNNNTATSIKPNGTVERVNASATQDGFTHVEAFDLQPFVPGATGTETTTFSVACSGVAASFVLRAQIMAGT